MYTAIDKAGRGIARKCLLRDATGSVRDLPLLPSMATKSAFGFVVLMACVTPVDETVTDQTIVGGSQATTTDFPTVVALQHGNGNWFCSGVLVDKDWVMTAASCFDNTNATQVRLGDANIADGTVSGQTITVTEIRKHPSFDINATVWSHDVALLKLATSVTDRTPTPIRRDAMTVGASITQAGFGTNNNNGSGGGVLRSLTSTSIDCAGAGDSGITNANLLCFNAADGTGSCDGDGGAPAFITGTTGRIVVGVGSGGTESSCTQGLDIYTSLTAELAFIDTVIPPVTTPPGNPPSPPPGGNPDPGSTDTPRDPNAPDGDGRGPSQAVGCSSSGTSSGWLMVLGVVFALVRRRRTQRRGTIARATE